MKVKRTAKNNSKGYKNKPYEQSSFVGDAVKALQTVC
jgi:hypothetical protein